MLLKQKIRYFTDSFILMASQQYTTFLAGLEIQLETCSLFFLYNVYRFRKAACRSAPITYCSLKLNRIKIQNLNIKPKSKYRLYDIYEKMYC